MFAILKGHEVVPVKNVVEWGKALEAGHKDGTWRVGNDFVKTDTGVALQVSTVFMGVQYSYMGPPAWFETAVFILPDEGARESIGQWRYATWEEAESGHAACLMAALIPEWTPAAMRQLVNLALKEGDDV